MSIPAHFKITDASRADILTAYYGDEIEENCAFGVLKRAKDPKVRTLVVTGSLDPEDEICQPSDEFVERWQSQFGESGLSVQQLEGHNHFSTVMALGTGIEKEETLGATVLEWIGK